MFNEQNILSQKCSSEVSFQEWTGCAPSNFIFQNTVCTPAISQLYRCVKMGSTIFFLNILHIPTCITLQVYCWYQLPLYRQSWELMCKRTTQMTKICSSCMRNDSLFTLVACLLISGHQFLWEYILTLMLSKAAVHTYIKVFTQFCSLSTVVVDI